MQISTPPPNMVDFFAASQGTWLTRRAVHHLDHQADEAGNSNLIILPFDQSDPSVNSICAALGVIPASAADGARFWWESNLTQGSMDPDNAAVLIDVPLQADSRKGFSLRDKGYVEKAAVMSTYSFADDGVLSITTRNDTNVGIQRSWFVTDQVRIRVSSAQFIDGVSMTTYCTELLCPTAETIKAIAAQAEKQADV